MKLMIVSQKIDINGDNLGFSHGCLNGIAKFFNLLKNRYQICLFGS
jgi:hypothetical protein